MKVWDFFCAKKRGFSPLIILQKESNFVFRKNKLLGYLNNTKTLP